MFCLIIHFDKAKADYLIFGPYRDYEAAYRDFLRRVNMRYKSIIAHDIIKMQEIGT